MNLTKVYRWGAFQSLASLPQISREAKKRLAWMDLDYYRKTKNVSLTCRHFGISRKTFYLWKKRYNPYRLESLEEKSKRPKQTRNWEVSRIQEFRILSLRRQYLRYGKEKLRILYERKYQESISSWKVQRVIEKHQLYYHDYGKNEKPAKPKSALLSSKKNREQDFLLPWITIVRYWNGTKRYILTGIDVHSKIIAFAIMYKSKHSNNAADFLRRIHYLLDARIENLQTDNGSEFAKEFREAVETLRLSHYFSRPKTPTDNSFDERFNRTLNEEFIEMDNMSADCDLFNRKLTDWLIEYNFHRPHQALGYEAPVECHYKYQKVLPMYPSSTAYTCTC